MNEKRLHQAGSALTWRAVQLAAIPKPSAGFIVSVTDLGMIPALVQGNPGGQR